MDRERDRVGILRVLRPSGSSPGREPASRWGEHDKDHLHAPGGWARSTSPCGSILSHWRRKGEVQGLPSLAARKVTWIVFTYRERTQSPLMGKYVIRFFVERERDRVSGIGALGLPGASTGVASLAVV